MMSLGEKFVKLRKEQGMSQEDVAEHLQVSRQTISNWENNITTPDIQQAKEISKLFHVSLDELLENDLHDILIEKVDRTQQHTVDIIRILKIIGIVAAAYIIINLVIIAVGYFAFVAYPSQEHETVSDQSVSITCSINDETWNYSIEADGEGHILTAHGDEKITDAFSIGDYEYYQQLLDDIETMFEKEGGSCY